MDNVTIGPAGPTTTRLGFGSSSIMGILNYTQSLALLESAFDAGIRHFDTAPMYGYGEAEACLGDFMKHHAGAVTITTKFGIPAEPRNALRDTVRRIARPVLQSFPGLKKRLQKATAGPAPAADTPPAPRTPNPIFTAEQARQSLESSLRLLKTDHIHVWLLHDVNSIDLPGNAVNDPLLRYMEDAVASGKVGIFGVGSDRNEVPHLLTKHPLYCRVTQYEWSVLNPVPEDIGAFRIHHRALSQNFHSVADTLKSDPEWSRKWSENTGADLADARKLASLMLKASYLLNPASILLFSSKNTRHIQDNVAVARDTSLDAPARKLYDLFQQEQMLPLPARNH